MNMNINQKNIIANQHINRLSWVKVQLKQRLTEEKEMENK